MVSNIKRYGYPYNLKTTLELADDLAHKAKKFAAQHGMTLRAVIEEGIRLILRDGRTKSTGFELRDATVDGDGISPEFADKAWSDIRDAAYKGRGS